MADATQILALILGATFLVLTGIAVYRFFILKGINKKLQELKDMILGNTIGAVPPVSQPKKQLFGFVKENPTMRNVTQQPTMQPNYQYSQPQPQQQYQQQRQEAIQPYMAQQQPIQQVKPFKPTKMFNTPEELHNFRLQQAENMRLAKLNKSQQFQNQQNPQ